MAEIYFTSDQVEQDSCELEEISRRLYQTLAGYREKKEIHDKLFEHALIIEELINEVEAENRSLANRKKGLHQQKEQIKKRWEEEEKEEEDEALQQEMLAEEENSQMAQLIWKMEEQNANQWLQNEELSAKMENLKREREEHKLSTHKQGFQHKLDEAAEALRCKDEEIARLSQMKIQKMQQEQMKTFEDLKKEKHELENQLSDFQEKQTLAALRLLKESLRDPLDASATGAENESSWRCYVANGLWKGLELSGGVVLGAVLSLGVLTSVTPVVNCPDPTCSLWDIVFEVLEPYSELSYTGGPVY
ncbi:trichohyalin-like isoform X2 [Mugil cephalus]|uniref:trichohyalin-like isoform X2 n=1 Tax=Mugil cephalus TaxID=48193 RepID=UPI001FB61584|nr:trichohyalin-like isoform X2 [Mugil cephalus]